MTSKSVFKAKSGSLRPAPPIFENPQVKHEIIDYNNFNELDAKPNMRYKLEIKRKGNSPARHPSRFNYAVQQKLELPGVRNRSSEATKNIIDRFQTEVVEREYQEPPKFKHKPPYVKKPFPVTCNDGNILRRINLPTQDYSSNQSQPLSTTKERSSSPIFKGPETIVRSKSVARRDSKITQLLELQQRLPAINRAESIRRVRVPLQKREELIEKPATIIMEPEERNNSPIREIKSKAFSPNQAKERYSTLPEEMSPKRALKTQLLRKITDGSKIKAHTPVPRLQKVIHTEADNDDAYTSGLLSRYQSVVPQNISTRDSFNFPSEETRAFGSLRGEAEIQEKIQLTVENKVSIDQIPSGYKIQSKNVVEIHVTEPDGTQTPHFHTEPKFMNRPKVVQDLLEKKIKNKGKLTIKDLYQSGTFMRGHLKLNIEPKELEKTLQRKTSRENLGKVREQLDADSFDISFSGSFGVKDGKFFPN